jgi:class 3 adenylate cyclase
MDATTTLPTGTVTFLFTDIEGSTRLLRHLEERYPAVLADHHRLLRAAFQPWGGQEIGTDGDAFFVVFRRATDAVAAAVAAQRAVAACPWLADAPVRVRIGLHTGEVAADFLGRAANSLSRDDAAELLIRARARAKPVNPARLGYVGPDVFDGYAYATTTRSSRHLWRSRALLCASKRSTCGVLLRVRG